MKLLVLASVLACALAGPTGMVLPRLPLNTLLRGGVKLVDPRIVGGVETLPGELKFQVSLQYRGFGGWSHMCGGSIFDENWVVCASHCVDGEVASGLRILAGEWDQSASSGNEQVRLIDRFIMHPQYDAYTTENDVSLIHVSTPFVWADWVGPIALPEQGQVTPAGTVVTVAGWGTLNSGDFTLPNVMREVDVPIVSDDDCNIAYLGDVYPSMICAGLVQGGVDSCQGDSGGPLFSGHSSSTHADLPSETPQLIGIVSWGYGCAYPGYPGVYTEVSYFVDWIKANAV